jgi:[ribosomal protein S18]-alanine N-acetyltransferase
MIGQPTSNVRHHMHAGVAVHPASLEHALQIAEMSRDYIEYGLGWRWTEHRISKAIAAPDVNAVVVLHESSVVAFGIMIYEERHSHLQLLAVRPEHRRKGLASAVIGWLEKSARAAGSERILVECRRTNSPARCLYLEHGYHEKNIEVAMYRRLDDGIHLEKWLRTRSTAGDA